MEPCRHHECTHGGAKPYLPHIPFFTPHFESFSFISRCLDRTSAFRLRPSWTLLTVLLLLAFLTLRPGEESVGDLLIRLLRFLTGPETVTRPEEEEVPDLKKRNAAIKKAFALTIALVICISLCSCGMEEKHYEAKDYILETDYSFF